MPKVTQRLAFIYRETNERERETNPLFIERQMRERETNERERERETNFLELIYFHFLVFIPRIGFLTLYKDFALTLPTELATNYVKI